MTLTLQRTRDILADLGAMRDASRTAAPVLVGFAAETEDVVGRARAKRARKRVDLIVANDVSQPDRGFDADTNAVTIVGGDGDEDVPLQSKDRVASIILDRVEDLLRARGRFARLGADLTVSNEQLNAHLEFFGELGVEGCAATPRGARAPSHQLQHDRRTRRHLPAGRLAAAEAARSAPVSHRRCNRSRAIETAGQRSASTSVPTAPAASCIRSGASRSCSASAIPTRT